MVEIKVDTSGISSIYQLKKKKTKNIIYAHVTRNTLINVRVII